MGYEDYPPPRKRRGEQPAPRRGKQPQRGHPPHRHDHTHERRQVEPRPHRHYDEDRDGYPTREYPARGQLPERRPPRQPARRPDFDRDDRDSPYGKPQRLRKVRVVKPRRRSGFISRLPLRWKATGVMLALVLSCFALASTDGTVTLEGFAGRPPAGSKKPPATVKQSQFLQLTAASSKKDVAAAGKQLLDLKYVSTTNKNCYSNKMGPREDLLSGKLYYKVVVFLQKAAAAHYNLTLSCVMHGHPPNGLLHPNWKAIDVSWINGKHVVDQGAEIRKFGKWMSDQKSQDLPYMIGGPRKFVDNDRFKSSGSSRRGPYFTNQGHEDHWHIGFECNPNKPDRFCYKGSERRSSLLASYRAEPWV